MVRRTQSRGLGGSRVYKWPSGAGKTEISVKVFTSPTAVATLDMSMRTVYREARPAFRPDAIMAP